MTSEEFLEAAEDVMVPAVSAVIELAFQTVPRDDVGPLIASYLGTLTKLAIGRVHEILAQTESGANEVASRH